MSRITLRLFLFLLCVLATKSFLQAQFNPFIIVIQRDSPLPGMLTESSCITGKLYLLKNEGEIPTVACQFAYTLERPWKLDHATEDSKAIPGLEYSCIKAGRYDAFVRDDGGHWRIELKYPNRSNIQIHAGNFPSNTVGCILLGTKGEGCSILDSQNTLKSLKALYGDGASRPVVVIVRD